MSIHRRRLRAFAIISAFIISLYCMFVNDDDMYNYLFLIPMVYSISFFVFSVVVSKRDNYGLGLVYAISQVLIYIRYVLTPFFTVFSASFTSWGWGPDPSNGQMLFAELLMCGELCLILLVQYLTIHKFSRQRYLNRIKKSYRQESYWLLFFYAIFAVVLVLLVQPALLLMDNYFVYSGSTTVNEVSNAGFYVILADTFKKIFLIIALIICKRRYDRRKNKLYLLLAVAAVAINMALNTGGTRIRMVFALVLGVYFLHLIFGGIPKLFYLIGGVLCLISFLSVSTVKFSYALGNSIDPVLSVLSIMMGQFQDYFAGPRLVGQMLHVHKIYGDQIGLSTFINDFMGSVPVISNYVDQTNRINYYFNIYNHISNQTLIAPILGIGYCYFPFFPFIFSIMFEYFAIKLDYKMVATDRISYKYLYAYMGYVCAMCMGYSTQNIYAQFISAFIPLLILFKVNDKVRLRTD